MAQELRTLAEHLRPRLKPARGPTPEVEHIMAAVLMVRDARLSARAACRMVPNVNERAANSRVAKLAVKLRPLLTAAELSASLPQAPTAQQLPPHPTNHLNPSHPVPGPSKEQQPDEELDHLDWGLPPLSATLELPYTTLPLASPTEADRVQEEREILEPFVQLALRPAASTPPSSPLPATSPLATTSLGSTSLASMAPTSAPPASTLPALAPPASAPTASAPPASALPAMPRSDAPAQQAVPKQSQRPHPFDQAAYDSFQVPESARADLDKDAYIQREALRDPDWRCLLPPALRRRRPLPAQHAAMAASKGHTGRSARKYIQNYGYLHGIGQEPEDLGDDWEGTMFTPTAPDHKPQKWYHDESSDIESDSSEGVPPTLLTMYTTHLNIDPQPAAMFKQV